MFDTPVRHSRPARHFDGEGSVETVHPDAGVLYIDPVVQDGKITVQFGADEDVRIGDLLEVPHNLFLKPQEA
jgi:hypothetical protein